ncbi:MAG: rhodanese-like domain-containing protein, partial [Dehalococcoidia bacterium]|nr:rhodanese-like domain-containing protein [Dehalococcoidia bacterium]
IRAATGAEIAAPARGNYQFPHRRMEEGAEIQLGALRFVSIETPGHTSEHIAWLVYEEGSTDAVAVFTGGSLIVGSAGRTDLLGEELTESLTRSQYQTLRRLSTLPANVQVLPTHGAGSFCSLTPPGMGRTTTIRAEQQSNEALAVADEETFLKRHRAGFLAYPSYYRHIGPINLSGPRVMGRLPMPKALAGNKVDQLVRSGVLVIDGRDGQSFAQSHLPGSINIELGTSFATYVGWVTPFNSRLVLVLPTPVDESAREAATQLFRIGYERIEGYLDGGIDAWLSSGREVRSYPSAGIEDLCQVISAGQPVHLLDVRQQAEWDSGHIPGSLHIFVGDLPGHLDKVPRNAEIWTACSSGYRSAIAASLLDRAGIRVRVVARSGVPELFARCLPWEGSAAV